MLNNGELNEATFFSIFECFALGKEMKLEYQCCYQYQSITVEYMLLQGEKMDLLDVKGISLQGRYTLISKLFGRLIFGQKFSDEIIIDFGQFRAKFRTFSNR